MPVSRPRIAVIGAGLAGLGAAWRLASRGCEVVLLERRERAGGRFVAHRTRGWSADRSLPLLGGADSHLLAWIRELGHADSLLPLRTLRIEQLWHGRRTSINELRGTDLRWRAALRTLRLRRLMRRFGPCLDPAAPERAARLDDRSVAEFARLYFGRNALERWVAPRAMSAAPGDAADLSRVFFLLQCAASPAPPSLPRRDLTELVRDVSGRLGARLGSGVERIETRAARGFRVRTRCDGRAEESFDADAVVVATAAPEAARIAAPMLTPPERDFLMEVSYVPALTLCLGLDRPPGPRSRLLRVPRRERSPIALALFEPGGDAGRAPSNCGLASVAASSEFARGHIGASDAVVVRTLIGSLDALQPGLSKSVQFERVQRAFVPHFGVGAYRAMDRFARVQRDRRALGRRLYFAGDHLCGPSAENALVSGLRAAEAFLADTR